MAGSGPGSRQERWCRFLFWFPFLANTCVTTSKYALVKSFEIDEEYLCFWWEIRHDWLPEIATHWPAIYYSESEKWEGIEWEMFWKIIFGDIFQNYKLFWRKNIKNIKKIINYFRISQNYLSKRMLQWTVFTNTFFKLFLKKNCFLKKECFSKPFFAIRLEMIVSLFLCNNISLQEQRWSLLKNLVFLCTAKSGERMSEKLDTNVNIQ